MRSYPRFSMPSVVPGHVDLSTVGGSDQPPAESSHVHHHIRVAVGGRVIERELSDPEPSTGQGSRATSR